MSLTELIHKYQTEGLMSVAPLHLKGEANSVYEFMNLIAESQPCPIVRPWRFDYFNITISIDIEKTLPFIPAGWWIN